MLNENEQKQLQEALVQEEQRILAAARNTFDLSREGAGDQGRDSIDQSNSEELVSTHLRLRDRERKLLIKVRDAIARLNDGTIDECEECGEPIAFKRLLVRPVTNYCIACKEEAEENERQLTGAEDNSSPE
ncbi:MAG: TraR/DksA C4-type zinc finger protein [Deltaproteobacteria bacterium]|nr:TraR/DksA C4-type zinc finger protein [Deltaproteobacteria bacterium]